MQRSEKICDIKANLPPSAGHVYLPRLSGLTSRARTVGMDSMAAGHFIESFFWRCDLLTHPGSGGCTPNVRAGLTEIDKGRTCRRPARAIPRKACRAMLQSKPRFKLAR